MVEQKRLTIDVPKELLDQCAVIAEQVGESRSTIIRLAIRAGLDNLPIGRAAQRLLDMSRSALQEDEEIVIPGKD